MCGRVSAGFPMCSKATFGPKFPSFYGILQSYGTARRGKVILLYFGAGGEYRMWEQTQCIM